MVFNPTIPSGFALLTILLSVLPGTANGGFARTIGTHFVIDGRPFYSNGFNAYWLMYTAADPTQRDKVSAVFQQAANYSMNVVRTWAFSDGGYRPLQISPGVYNEDMFKALDFVIYEAKRNGVYLILSLVNNYDGYGGRNQYVQWARSQGQYVSSEDDFYTNDVIKGFYKNHVKAVLTRMNTITGISYMNDPTIFAWELINEPRCQTDLSGTTLQEWIKEMAIYLKSIDSNHLLEVGIEGFYGESIPERKQFNPGFQIGTDFIDNHMTPDIDFATIHVYPEQWMPGADEQGQLDFMKSWIQSHIDDSTTILGKPLMVTEFGKSTKLATEEERDNYFWSVYNAIYVSARVGGSSSGGLFWQLLADGMDNFRDGYEVASVSHRRSPPFVPTMASELKSAALLDQMKVHLATDAGKELVKKIGLVYELHIAPKKLGVDEEIYVVDLKEGQVTKGPYKGKPDATFSFADKDFLAVATGKTNPQMAFIRGLMKIKGSISAAQKFTPDIFPKPSKL